MNILSDNEIYQALQDIEHKQETHQWPTNDTPGWLAKIRKKYDEENPGYFLSECVIETMIFKMVSKRFREMHIMPDKCETCDLKRQDDYRIECSDAMHDNYENLGWK
jgi:hypothetical protein